jgi:hypothetical protein
VSHGYSFLCLFVLISESLFGAENLERLERGVVMLVVVVERRRIVIVV